MSGETTGAVRWVLRLDGLCVLIAASLFYPKLGFSWGTFALFFLTLRIPRKLDTHSTAKWTVGA